MTGGYDGRLEGCKSLFSWGSNLRSMDHPGGIERCSESTFVSRREDVNMRMNQRVLDAKETQEEFDAAISEQRDKETTAKIKRLAKRKRKKA